MNKKIALLPHYLNLLVHAKRWLNNIYRDVILSITEKPLLNFGFRLRLSLEGAFKIFSLILISPILLTNITTAYCLDYLTPKISKNAYILKTGVNLAKNLINLGVLIASLWGYLTYALPFVAQTLSPSLGLAGTAGSYMMYGCSLLILAFVFSPGTDEQSSHFIGYEPYKIEFMKEQMERFKQHADRAFQFFIHSSITRLLGSLLVAPFTILLSLTVLGRLAYVGAERAGIIKKSEIEPDIVPNIVDAQPSDPISLEAASKTYLTTFKAQDDKIEEQDAALLRHPEHNRGISLNFS